GRVRRRTLVVVAPLVRVVAVEVHAVARGDLAVPVVVPQVLAPEALTLGAGEVVAVRVGDRHEPQVGAVHDPGDALVVPVAGQHVVEQAPDHLRRDPLTGVLGADVDSRGARPVTGGPGVAADLHGNDVLALSGLPDRHELGDVGVGLGL